MEVKEVFEQAQNKERRQHVKRDPNRMKYHLMPPVGWLNDPNGLYQKDGKYHIFYQYVPENANGVGHKGWGHYETEDFIHFKELPVAVYPDQFMDGKGAYSGSAFPYKDKVHFFYTGNNKLQGDYDYINNGRIHWTNHFTSEDGEHFSEKETLLKNEDYPEDISNHVRDPKIIEDDHFYMALGARSKDSKGQVLIFESDDLEHWKPASRILPEEEFGYMWECPDIFDLDGKRILITCPQGVATDGYLYENLYQNGWFEIDKDLSKTQKVKDFKEFDNGFDFYAPQTFLDEKGRRILIGWMGVPDVPYTNEPTLEYDWQHALTLPRELHYKNGRLYQYPIAETLELREEEKNIELKPGVPVDLKSKVFELQLEINNRPFKINLRKDAVLSYDGHLFTLSLGASGYGRDSRHIEINTIDTLSIFSDSSSLEIFINQGERALTTRLYDDQKDTTICSDTELNGKLYLLRGYEIEDLEA